MCVGWFCGSQSAKAALQPLRPGCLLQELIQVRVWTSGKCRSWMAPGLSLRPPGESRAGTRSGSMTLEVFPHLSTILRPFRGDLRTKPEVTNPEWLPVLRGPTRHGLSAVSHCPQPTRDAAVSPGGLSRWPQGEHGPGAREGDAGGRREGHGARGRRNRLSSG